jgi:hypothetical protein
MTQSDKISNKHDNAEILINILAKNLFAQNIETNFAKTLLKDCIVEENVHGIFFRSNFLSEPLMVSIIKCLLNDGRFDSSYKNQSEKILSAINLTSKELNFSPYNNEPGWQTSPILCWVNKYIKTGIFPIGFSRIHRNLLWKVNSGLEKNDNRFSLTKTTKNFVDKIIQYSNQLSSVDKFTLFTEPTAENLLKILLASLENNPPKDKRLTGNSFRTYETRINSALSHVHPSEWLHKKQGGPPKGGIVNDFENEEFIENEIPIEEILDFDYESLPKNASEVIDFKKVANRNLNEIITVIKTNAEVENPKIRISERKKKIKSSYFEPWPLSIPLNPTRYTPGVLKTTEITKLINFTFLSYKKGNQIESVIERVVLLGGIFYGWTHQLYESIIQENFPSVYCDNSLVVTKNNQFVWTKLDIPVGWPKKLYPTSPNSWALKQKLAKSFEAVEAGYLIYIYPWLLSDITFLTNLKKVGDPLISKDEYTKALSSLSNQLRKICPNSPKLTRGILFTTFQGLANSLNLNPIDRTIVCGRTLPSLEMPFNYTRVSLYTINQNLQNFLIQLSGEIVNQYQFLKENFDWDNWPEEFLNFSKVIKDFDPKIFGYTGSWSVPKVSTVKKMLTFLQDELNQKNLTVIDLSNFRTIYAVILFTILNCARSFDIDRMKLPNGYKNQVDNFSQPTKQKNNEENQTYVSFFIPTIIKDLWWAVIKECASDYSNGPILCLRNEKGERIPFKLYSAIEFVLNKMNMPQSIFRAYGLRHLGRTLFNNAGMAHNFINFKLNHYGTGYELNNPIYTIGYQEFSEENNKCCEIIFREIGLLHER